MSYRVRVVAKDHSDATVHSTEELLITVPGEESMSVDWQNPPHLSLIREAPPSLSSRHQLLFWFGILRNYACFESRQVYGNGNACQNCQSFLPSFFLSFFPSFFCFVLISCIGLQRILNTFPQIHGGHFLLASYK